MVELPEFANKLDLNDQGHFEVKVILKYVKIKCVSQINLVSEKKHF
jgi:hypothetical protein